MSSRPALVSNGASKQATPIVQISKMFMREYEEQTGQPVRFRLSFAGSGTQARAVIDGLPADLVALALPLDVMKISEKGAPCCPPRAS
jgi:ABC-type sulfate transport system substrate-binding protein